MLLRQAVNQGAPFHLALLDYQMPDMDGIALAHAIKADPALCDTALVMLTSVDRHGHTDRLREIGLTAHLTKPVKQAPLYECLTTVGPCAPGTREQRKVADLRPPHRTARRRLNVLLAEDNIVNQKVTQRMLERMGHTVEVAENGHEALACVQKARYDVILMDCNMPEVDGFEATRLIRESEHLTGADVPIIALTANAMEGDRETCLAAGMNDYLSKPVKFDVLVSTLERVAEDARFKQVDTYRLVSLIADEEFGIDILKVQEIIRALDMKRVTNAPEFVEGVINLRGQIVPVVDLRRRFNLPPKEKDSNTRIIVVALSGKTVGFLVDSVQEVIRVETTVIEPPPERVKRVATRYITGVARLEDRLLSLLDLDRVLTTDEQEALVL